MIVIVDGFGSNLASLSQALHRLNCEFKITNDPHEIQNASKVILPGVGHAGDMSKRLGGLLAVLRDLSQPVLGICLGMQILFKEHAEGEVQGLGILDGRVQKLEDKPEITVPHMGWNQLSGWDPTLLLLRGVTKESHFYFVHSYVAPSGPWVKGWTEHGDLIPAVVSQGNWHGVQFHPEKSGADGHLILKNFLELS